MLKRFEHESDRGHNVLRTYVSRGFILTAHEGGGDAHIGYTR